MRAIKKVILHQFIESGNKPNLGMFVFTVVLFTGLALPERMVIPVQGATTKDWNHNTFWHEPWGSSGVHKGIDVFSPAGKPIISSTYGFVIFSGNIEKGGNVVVILGPKWRVHYYAHLNDSTVNFGEIVDTSDLIGVVGNSGNAKNKPPHLHYSIFTLLPYFWRGDVSTQGWKKMFYLNPSEKLLEVSG